MPNNKIYIYYRHYNAGAHGARARDPNKGRPKWFSYSNCLKNIIKTCCNQESTEVNLIIWYDGNINDISSDQSIIDLTSFKIDSKYLKLNILHNEWKGPTSSWIGLIDYILKNHNDDDDIIYLLENDYLHQTNWINNVLEVYASELKFDYLSLYDHADNYHLPTHKKFQTEFFYTKNQIWRTIFSTCGSFITTLKNIRNDEAALKTLPDFQLFLHLSVQGKILITSIPGLSTHAMLGLESPAVNWEYISKETDYYAQS